MAELNYIHTHPLMSRRHHKGKANIVNVTNRIVPSAPLLKDYNHFHISVEGNIGVGKSTILRELAGKFGRDVGVHPVIFPEPVAEWQSYGQNQINLLQKMYDNDAAWTNDSLTFQMVATLSKVRQLGKNDDLKFVERSLDSQLNIFIPVLRQQGKITELEQEILIDAITTFKQHIPNLNPDLYIYLEMSPEIAFHRIQARGRAEECNLDLDYLKALEVKHTGWLKDASRNNVLAVNVNSPAPIDYEDLIEQIKNRLEIIVPNVLKGNRN